MPGLSAQGVAKTAFGWTADFRETYFRFVAHSRRKPWHRGRSVNDPKRTFVVLTPFPQVWQADTEEQAYIEETVERWRRQRR